MPSTSVPPPFKAYKGDEPYLFVSYAHRDAEEVFSVLLDLHYSGLNIWYDEGIDPGNEWPEEIACRLKSASSFVVFISASSIASSNVRDEIYFALNNRVPFLAVHLDDAKLPPGLELRMSGIQAIYRDGDKGLAFKGRIIDCLPGNVCSGSRRRALVIKSSHVVAVTTVDKLSGTPVANATVVVFVVPQKQSPMFLGLESVQSEPDMGMWSNSPSKKAHFPGSGGVTPRGGSRTPQ